MTAEQADTYYYLNKIGWYAVDNSSPMKLIMEEKSTVLSAYLQADGTLVQTNQGSMAHNADTSGETGDRI